MGGWVGQFKAENLPYSVIVRHNAGPADRDSRPQPACGLGFCASKLQGYKASAYLGGSNYQVVWEWRVCQTPPQEPHQHLGWFPQQSWFQCKVAVCLPTACGHGAL